MKFLFQLLLLLLSLFIAWKFWPSKTEPIPAPTPTPMATSTPPPPTPVPVPSKSEYVEGLQELFQDLTADIVPRGYSNKAFKRVNKKDQLTEAWETGYEMFNQKVLTAKEAEFVVSFIKTMNHIQDLRNKFYDRYEMAYNLPKHKLAREKARDYTALRIEWENRTQALRQQAQADLDELEANL